MIQNLIALNVAMLFINVAILIFYAVYEVTKKSENEIPDGWKEELTYFLKYALLPFYKISVLISKALNKKHRKLGHREH